MRFKKSPQLPGAGRTRAGHHHGSDMSTSPRAVLYHTGANLCTILHTTVYAIKRALEWSFVPVCSKCIFALKAQPESQNQTNKYKRQFCSVY